MSSPPSPGFSLPRLVDIMSQLLGPDGCPWDREQTLESLKPYLLEECYELLEAMDGSAQHHCEELGDLLFQIVFQTALRSAHGAFDIDDVVAGIADKLTRRHPHVFADATVGSTDEVRANWEEIKAQERQLKGAPPGLLAGIPKTLPPLARAQKISARVSRVGFDWPDAAGCKAKVLEELDEIDRAQEAGNQQQIASEIGDLLFAVVSLARKLGVDATIALNDANKKFERRFAFIEERLRDNGTNPEQSSLEEMDALWNRAKEELEDDG